MSRDSEALGAYIINAKRLCIHRVSSFFFFFSSSSPSPFFFLSSPFCLRRSLSRNSSAANLGISRRERESGTSVKFRDTVEEILKREDKWNRACDKCCTAINYPDIALPSFFSFPFFSSGVKRAREACTRTEAYFRSRGDARRRWKWENKSENLLESHPAVPLSLACTSSCILSAYINPVYADTNKNQSVDDTRARVSIRHFSLSLSLSLALSLSLQLCSSTNANRESASFDKGQPSRD